jgi:hypothetical protein
MWPGISGHSRNPTRTRLAAPSEQPSGDDHRCSGADDYVEQLRFEVPGKHHGGQFAVRDRTRQGDGPGDCVHEQTGQGAGHSRGDGNGSGSRRECSPRHDGGGSKNKRERRYDPGRTGPGRPVGVMTQVETADALHLGHAERPEAPRDLAAEEEEPAGDEKDACGKDRYVAPGTLHVLRLASASDVGNR